MNTATRFACAVILSMLAAFVSEKVVAKENSDCYATLSYGFGTVKYLGTDRLEDRLFAEEYFIGTYVADRRSNPYSFGIGCDMGKYWSIDVAHREGLSAKVNSLVALGDDYQILSNDTLDVKRYAELSGYSLTISGKLNLYGPVYATGKIGAMYGRAFVAITSPKVPDEIEISRRVEGVVPIVGMGILYKPKDSRLAFGIDGELYHKYVRIWSVYTQIRF